MPRVFRVMRRDVDNLPTISPTSLGVRAGTDVDLDSQGKVLVNGKGMSVAPNWRDINVTRVPKRLRPLLPGAAGSNAWSCFCAGTGPFEPGAFSRGLSLEPDSATHGVLAPAEVVPLATYEADLAATRASWQVDET